MHAYNKACRKTFDNVRSSKLTRSSSETPIKSSESLLLRPLSNPKSHNGTVFVSSECIRCSRCEHINKINTGSSMSSISNELHTTDTIPKFCVLCGMPLETARLAGTSSMSITRTGDAIIKAKVQQALDLLAKPSIPSLRDPFSSSGNLKSKYKLTPVVQLKPPNTELPNVYPHVRPDRASVDRLELDPNIKESLKERLRIEPILSMRNEAQETYFMASLLEIENARHMESAYQEIAESNVSLPKLQAIDQPLPSISSPSMIPSSQSLFAPSIDSFASNSMFRSMTGSPPKRSAESSRKLSANGRRKERKGKVSSPISSRLSLSLLSTSISIDTTKGGKDKGKGYLDHIQPVTVFYKQLLEREEELKGLTVKVLDLVRGMPTDHTKLSNSEDSPLDANDTVHRTDERVMWFWGKEAARQEDLRQSATENGQNPAAMHPMIWTDLLIDNYAEEVEALSSTVLGERNDLENALPSGDKLNVVQEDDGTIDSDGSITSQKQGSNDTKAASAILSRIYRNSCLRIKKAVEYAHIDFRRDPITWPNALLSVLTKFETVSYALEQAQIDDQQARDAYEQFKRDAARRRADAANAVAEALSEVSNKHAHFKTLYEAATREFEAKRAAQEFSLQLNYVKHSDDKMDRIQEHAEEELGKYGQILKDLQQAEVDLIEDLR